MMDRARPLLDFAMLAMIGIPGSRRNMDYIGPEPIARDADAPYAAILAALGIAAPSCAVVISAWARHLQVKAFPSI